MSVVNGEAGFTELTKLHVSDKLIATDLEIEGAFTINADLDMNGFDIRFDTGTGIEDAAGHEIVLFEPNATDPINYLVLKSGGSAGMFAADAKITAAGDDADVSIRIVPKGLGTIKIPDGTLQIGGTVVTADGDEINIAADGATVPATITLVGTDGFVVNAAGVMTQALISDIGDYVATDTQTLENKTINSAANTITITAANVSDFDTEVSNNVTVAQNTTDIASLVSGVKHKADVETSTSGLGNITLSGEQTLNGLLTSTDRVIVVDQTLGEENGIYVTAAGAWARAADYNTDAEINNGDIIYVNNTGSTKHAFNYLLTTEDPITVDTTPLVYSEHADIVFASQAEVTAGVAAGKAIDPLALSGSSPQFTAIQLGHASDTTISRVSAGVVAVEGVTLLNTATGQPLDADLTSWAGVTRASGFDTFAATPTSANLASLVTNETGTGALVFGTAPQISTIELGAATDTTISRVSAGVLAVEGVQILTTATLNQIDVNTIITATGLTASVNDYDAAGNAGFDTANLIRQGADALWNITGIKAPAAGVYRIISIVNTSAFNMNFAHDSASSTAANRMYLRNNVDKALQPNEIARLWYDHSVSRWMPYVRIG